MLDRTLYSPTLYPVHSPEVTGAILIMKTRIQAEVISSQMSGSAPRRVPGILILRLAKGLTRWSVDGKDFEVREGQGILVLPGQVFGGIESLNAIPITVKRLDLSLSTPGDLLSVKSFVPLFPIAQRDAKALVEALLKRGNPVVDFDSVGGDLFGEVFRGASETRQLEQFHVRSCLLALLTRVCLQGGKTSARDDSGAERRVGQFLEKLEEHCEEDWALDDMASAAKLKRSQFGILCRQLTGESPAIYLNRLRIRRSRELLRETNLSVTDISMQCGFSSSQYFAKLFRRFQGHEPTHYRRISRKMNPGESIGYIKGESARIVMIADREIGPGDFCVDGELTLDRLGDTAASLEFGRDRFGFDGREGRLFLEGENFGEIRYFDRSSEIIREGLPFTFALRRRGKRLSVSVNKKKIVSVNDDSDRSVGTIGLRPLRNGIHVARFEIDGKPTLLINKEP